MDTKRLFAIIGSSIIAVTAGGLAAGVLDSAPGAPKPAVLFGSATTVQDVSTTTDPTATTIPDAAMTSLDSNEVGDNHGGGRDEDSDDNDGDSGDSNDGDSGDNNDGDSDDSNDSND